MSGLPLEIIKIILEYLPNDIDLQLRGVSKVWDRLILEIVLREPYWDTFNLPLDNLTVILKKYGSLVRVLSINDSIMLETLRVIFRYCQFIHELHYYGNVPLWDEVDQLINHSNIKRLDYWFIGETFTSNKFSFNKFNKLLELSLGYSDMELINDSIQLVSPSLRKLTITKLKCLPRSLLNLISTKFKQLDSLQLQSNYIDEIEFNHFRFPMPNLKSLEIDITLFPVSSTCFKLDATKFPLLQHMKIDLHSMRTSGINCIITGVWSQLKTLSLSRLDTGDPHLINPTRFPLLTQIQLQVYVPLPTESLETIACHFPHLTSVRLNKFTLPDTIFHLPPHPTTFSPIRSFSLTNNTSPLGPHYLHFTLRYLPHLIKWSLPPLDSHLLHPTAEPYLTSTKSSSPCLSHLTHLTLDLHPILLPLLLLHCPRLTHLTLYLPDDDPTLNFNLPPSLHLTLL